MNLHHIGIATENIERTAELLKAFGYVAGETKKDPLQKVYVCFLKHPKAPLVELLGGVGCEAYNDSPIRGIIKKNGTSVYHLCYETEDIDEILGELRKQGYLPIGKKQPSLIEGRNVIFLYHKDNCLIELLEK